MMNNNNNLYIYVADKLQELMNSGIKPETILSNLVRQIPNGNIILNQFTQSGLSPERFLIQYFTQGGANLTPLTNELNKRGIKF